MGIDDGEGRCAAKVAALFHHFTQTRDNRAMTLAKKQKPPRVKTALRIPEELHREITQAAQLNDRSFNAEVLFRLSQFHTKESLDVLHTENAEIKAVTQEILRLVRTR
ncbi:Arc family DNA-binding protein [Pseudoduganella sp. FT26W]|uniref:Arc family DNA-binding protein n=1 Tax=Duganella aquatilis TaxID=2666082 RepID=A0A844DFE0_9BURK|nr:Arc family DNA-binding protein [Duganella aquatilis]MRW86799.1 Arc family DNA-binding protein [Duganella aquatilis]